MGCPSFLNWERVVISSKCTGFDILLNTFFKTMAASGKPPGYDDPLIGSVSFTQFVTPGSFHSVPLIHCKIKSLEHHIYEGEIS